MNIVSICENSNVLKIILFIKTLIEIVKFIIPMLLIIMVSLDLGKGIISGNEKQSEIIKASSNRILAAVIIFLLPTIVNLVMVLVDEKTSYESCWANAEISIIKKYELLEEQQKEEKKQEEQNKSDSEGISINSEPPDNSKTVADNIFKNYYKDFTYYLYLPDNLKSNFPIIVYLHDLNRRGSDYYNNSLNGITWGPLNEVRNYSASYSAIIIAPQVPANRQVVEFTKDYIQLINEIANKYSANKNRISVMGLSHGCFGVLQIVPENPNYFSAAVPIGCSWNKQDSTAEKFINQPVWAIRGKGDGANLEEFVNKINSYGGKAKYDYLDYADHNIFNNSYSILRDSNYDVINWMISQTK